MSDNAPAPWPAPPGTPIVPLYEETITVDLTNVFDPLGTYANPPFPGSVNAAPRAEGPDGRAEVQIVEFFYPPLAVICREDFVIP